MTCGTFHAGSGGRSPGWSDGDGAALTALIDAASHNNNTGVRSRRRNGRPRLGAAREAVKFIGGLKQRK
jgi:hypothetical protein